MPSTMLERVQRVSWIALACATVLRAFDAAYAFHRTVASVPADSLLHFNSIQWWWRFGDSLRGTTLTPSPSFIDFVLQIPIVLLTADFEQFSYGLALVYCVLITTAVYFVVRVVTRGKPMLTVGIAFGAVVIFYALSPFGLVVHAFMYNHTSEMFSTLGLLAAAHAWFRPDAERRRWHAPVYMALVALCIVSSPFFIATYCIPISFASAAILGTNYMNRRRLVWFGGMTAVGAIAGLVALAAISCYVWPVRGDHYLLTATQSYHLFADTIATEPDLRRLAISVALAALVAGVLVFVGRRRGWPAPVLFLLALLPASVLSCVLLPMKRGALGGAYEWRYLQLPWLLACIFYVGATIALVRYAMQRWQTKRELPRVPVWLVRALPAAMCALAVVIVFMLQGPLSWDDPRSTSAEMLQCARRAETSGGIMDGLGTVFVARYVNAARAASDWQSPSIVVQIYSGQPPILDPTESNVVWFDGAFRGGRGQLNFLATHTLDDDVLESVRRFIGSPDRTITCPVPSDMRQDGKPTFDFWIWDRADARQKLTDLVMHDNLRGVFTPVIGAKSMDIDLTWGVYTDPHDGALVDGHRVWKRGVNRESGDVAQVRSMLLPSGRYRFEIDLKAVPRDSSGAPVAWVQVNMERKAKELRRVPIPPGTTHFSVDFSLKNIGGPTSGDLMWIDVFAHWTDEIEITGLKLTLVEQAAMDPFRIFR